MDAISAGSVKTRGNKAPAEGRPPAPQARPSAAVRHSSIPHMTRRSTRRVQPTSARATSTRSLLANSTVLVLGCIHASDARVGSFFNIFRDLQDYFTFSHHYTFFFAQFAHEIAQPGNRTTRKHEEMLANWETSSSKADGAAKGKAKGVKEVNGQ